MSFHDELLAETRAEREAFLAIPAIVRAMADGVDRATYLAFLAEAFHHVKHTCRLLGFAAGHTGDADTAYADALYDYIEEERGHEAWILDDIRAMGGDPDAMRRAGPGPACAAMVGYVYYAIQHVNPYAMLGMVHVLEGMSVALASGAARRLAERLGGGSATAGFRYLASHGAVDREHVRFFREQVDGIADPAARRAVVDTARVVYRLYGNVFREIDARGEEARHAA